MSRYQGRHRKDVRTAVSVTRMTASAAAAVAAGSIWLGAGAAQAGGDPSQPPAPVQPAGPGKPGAPAKPAGPAKPGGPASTAGTAGTAKPG
ncbi:hypothetical protein VPH29_24705, partial [Tsukamurella tyrosinosolvens]|nr:hypothetical protein [Tsukamurella tyrosinosolvens]